ncbi:MULTISPECIES: (2Fe-2S)-binding protein [Paenarthrobacter]|uniref:(2Fe-2S)-binding protein n=1 Tax=Paenarthrobacter ureafaciens TaxID=37931 RepID=A0AAX3ENB6_PAEUR|nr:MULTISPECIES: (2Fe-2S)-binding protein [Paenarthrobacter]NKR13545.1 (2Fe-2S)-binding protein [Arthrobacter sp. M5]NKR15468.1 (2Fe-2S)-binding protein [Arthrobacter sp. M6]OEH59329.1 (2Fe-2S)-binding protein [Arthrobacter sp. D2]OEH60688.1 (2Fe-2S)-binding protein [Arthrobacter sp. D4]MDO5864391.1 (2Fe-2S)-binding protein [Paenarthrobacter sp. SD-2]
MTTQSTTDSAYRRAVTVTVNGKEFTRDVDTRTTLADWLREDLQLVSVHLGCEQGACGCCNVLLDGQSVRSCLMLAVQANGHEVETVESLSADPGNLHPIQEAFHEEHGLQCGFCTPAMVLRTKELLAEQQHRTDEEVRDGISGILCRCTGYQNIVNSVQCAARKLSKQSPAPIAAGAGTGDSPATEGKA